LYEVLGKDINKDSTREAIVEAWKEQMLHHHPDHKGAANVKDSKSWENVKLAGKVLKNKENRKRYDQNGDADVAWLNTHATNPYLIMIYTPSNE